MSQVAPFPKEVKSWLKQAEDFRFEVRGTKVIAFPNVHLSEYDLFRQELKVVHAGVTIGELKGKDVIPDHSLAMSTQLNHDGFSCFELTYEQAIAYLRKEAITLDASVPRGYILLTYKIFHWDLPRTLVIGLITSIRRSGVSEAVICPKNFLLYAKRSHKFVREDCAYCFS